ncbi:DNA gyrase inhibitor YacG [Yoonia sp.]|uniref:DNA gyrase inhibitor YacG n=1 Tax=Yoonia sp. TaxID=2212373 RepID=UPI003A4DE1D8
MACPICDRPTDKAFRPFCSKRCADVDLGKWLTGSYAIPAGRDDAEDGETDPADEDDGKLH